MATIMETKQYILDQLHTLSVCQPNTMRTQWTVRCPFCGDSKDLSHGHLSIQIDLNDDDAPMLYRCFKCEASGILDANLMSELGLVVDDGFKDGIRKATKRASKKSRFTNDRIESYSVITPKMSPLVQVKLDYLNRRLGANFTVEDSISYKLILDLETFIYGNNIDPFLVFANREMDRQKSLWMLQHFNENYIGFLSASNNVITCRYIGQDPRFRRYHKIILNPNNKNPASFYMKPGAASLYDERPIKLHISEGIFDILGVYLMNPDPDERTIYAASCGFGPNTIIEYVVRNGLAQDLELHIYCDNDKTDNEVRNLLLRRPEVLAWVRGDIYFHRNQYQGEKDYGVSQDHIVNGIKKVGSKGFLQRV